MADRKQTPQNLLDNLLGGGQGAGIPARQDTSTTVTQRASKPVRRPPSKTVEEAPKRPLETLHRPPEGERPKATYYLSQQALDGLDEAWLKLRKMATAEDRARVSKSIIVEQAILLALAELEAKGKKSPLAQRLIRPG